MQEKPVKGDKLWRTTALIVLCGLVYYFSYDHGRQAENRRFEAYQLTAVAAAENQRREIVRLLGILKKYEQQQNPNDPTPAINPLASTTQRLSLRINQSRILFDDRLVVTLLEVNSLENRAIFRFNFLLEERILTAEMETGSSYQFPLDWQNWALVLSSLSISSANISVVELQE